MTGLIKAERPIARQEEVGQDTEDREITEKKKDGVASQTGGKGHDQHREMR